MRSATNGPDVHDLPSWAQFAENEAFDFGVYALYPSNRHLTARVRALVDHLAATLAAA